MKKSFRLPVLLGILMSITLIYYDRKTTLDLKGIAKQFNTFRSNAAGPAFIKKTPADAMLEECTDCTDPICWELAVTTHEKTKAQFDGMISAFFGNRLPSDFSYYAVDASVIEDIKNTISCSKYNLGIYQDKSNNKNNSELKINLIPIDGTIHLAKDVSGISYYPLALFSGLFKRADKPLKFEFSKAKDAGKKMTVVFRVSLASNNFYYADLSSAWPP